MHTITVYNENEVKELNDTQNIQGEDKVWIDLLILQMMSFKLL